ncbi:YcaO-like family protein [Pendulispora brunnea]|uniref:YcaO-like family protein n=1 Tax=Pendulispora brunnea TaxID=2905690 RepID=A0ABZ2K748_9BACT
MEFPFGSTDIEKKAPTYVTVFVGPSLDAARVRELVPFADIRPPIRRGDLDSVQAPNLVAIIDGVFDAELAVSPREIRTAIARGVRIVGSSSMGALRAAEVHEMLGVGRIYQMYRNGTIERDDEVAVLLDVDTGNALTEPLANIRFAVASLVGSGTLDEAVGSTIVDVASSIHFHDRTYRNILRNAGFKDPAAMDQLIRALRSIDLKREDAQTLLELLPELEAAPHWERVLRTNQRHDDYDDHFASVRVAISSAADAPLTVWEFGEKIEWSDLLKFLAVTGKFDRHARQVLARGAWTGLESLAPARDTQVPSVQELFVMAAEEWGWKGREEAHVTLRDLGIGFEELQEQLRRERRTQAVQHSLFTLDATDFMRALRVDLFLSNLALKREAMRLGALLMLAREAHDGQNDNYDGELREAKRALLCEMPEATWDGMLSQAGISENDAKPIVELIASARRVGVHLLGTLEDAPRRDGLVGRGVESLPLAPYAKGSSSRSIPDGEAAVIARKIGKTIGVTRVAQLGELERFGLHVTAAYRSSDWSSTIGGGKSESIDGATAGALMEELEKYCQERFEPDVVLEGGFHKLSTKSAIDPNRCALPFDSCYASDSSISWSWMTDLVTGERVLVARDLLSMRRQARDLLYSARRGRKVFSTSGLASGFTITEAILHALCERIERHAVKLAEQALSNPGEIPGAPRWPFTLVDLEKCTPSIGRIVQSIRDAGYQVRVMDITCEVSVPTFSARIFRPDGVHGLTEKYHGGSGTHPDPEIAVKRALLEAVQTRVGALSGAREDFGIRPRSLGRHERPRPLSRGDAYWIRPYVPKKPLRDVVGFVGQSARENVDFIVRRLTAAGFDRVLYRDLSPDDVAPGHVVRALVPGMEDTNPFHTGLRARTLMVQDLMRRHEW